MKMIAKIFPSAVSGALKAPPSKSCTQRALAAALLCHGTSIIEGIGNSYDELVALKIIKTLGAVIRAKSGSWIINSDNEIFTRKVDGLPLIVDCGESGLSTRMFASIASLFNFEIELRGQGSILTRPMDFLQEYLPHLGVEVVTNNNKVPITVRGPLRAAGIRVSSGVSSQFLTGLLFAFCKAARTPVRIEVDNLTSKPYIDLTISILKKFGFVIINNQYRSFSILPVGTQRSTIPVAYTVEGDWSNAAFLLVGGAVSDGIELGGLDLNSVQGDKKILYALKETGVEMKAEESLITINGSRELKAFNFDATDCPDLFPPLVALAANCGGNSRIRGVHRLLHKESNRAKALQDEFGKLGVHITLEGDVMVVTGGKGISGGVVSSHNDHRIAMAATVAAINSVAEIEIEKAEAINKSYPGFYDDMRSLGVMIETR